MATDVYFGSGTTLSQSSDGGSTYTGVVQVLEIGGVGMSAERVDTFNLASTWQVGRMTLPRGEQLTFTVQYDQTETTQIAFATTLADFANNNKYYKVTFPIGTGHSWSFQGGVAGFEIETVEPKGIITASVTIEVLGPITIG